MIVTKNHPYARKKDSYITKLSPSKKYRILELYIDLFHGKKSAFSSVNGLARHFKVESKRPAKIKQSFDKLWKKLYWRKKIDYKVNIFEERHKITIHKEKKDKKTDEMQEFLAHYPRAWYESFKAWMKQKGKIELLMKESTFIYRKPIILKKLWKPYKTKAYKHKKEASSSKEFFNKLYKEFDLIINLDGKSMEDIPTVQANPKLFFSTKWISQAMEIQSWALFKIAVEKSHNKTNALFIIKELTETIKWVLWENKNILFLTDAWSEYLNNKKLRWMRVTEFDTSWICKYLLENNCELMITRFKQDNGYIENKNKYVEIIFLDDYKIAQMSEQEFAEWLQDYMDLNNRYLEWSDEFVYRWKDITPLQNLSERFWSEKATELMNNFSVNYIESKHKLDDKYSKWTIYKLTNYISPYLCLSPNQSLIYKNTFPKSLDSSSLCKIDLEYKVHFHIVQLLKIEQWRRCLC